MTSPSPSRSSAPCGPRGTGGWSPPDLPADTPLKRLVDRIVPRDGMGACAFFAAVAIALFAAGSLPTRPYLGVVAVASALAGGWCAANFWRCRHAHCVVTAVGWLALAAFTAFEAALGRSVIGGNEDVAFLGILAVALLFELGVYAARGTNALVQEQPSDRPEGA